MSNAEEINIEETNIEETNIEETIINETEELLEENAITDEDIQELEENFDEIYDETYVEDADGYELELDTSSENSLELEGDILEYETDEEGNIISETTELVPTKMSNSFIGLSAIQCIVAFLLIVVVLRQSKTATPMTSSSLNGSSLDSESYWNKNKNRSEEWRLARTTIILGIIFFIVTFSLGFIK